jgi:Transposase DDE domain group 1
VRLADQIIAAAGTKLDDSYFGALSALGADIARAECFELSDDIREACDQVAESKPSSILSAMPMMRLPYAKTWIEWTRPPEGIYQIGSGPAEACSRPVRMGCLFDAPDGLDNGRMNVAMDWLPGVSDSEREPHAVPYAVYFDWAAGRDMMAMKAELHRAGVRDLAPEFSDASFAEAHLRTQWSRHAADTEELRAVEELHRRAITIPDMVRFAGWWHNMTPSKDTQLGFAATVDCLWDPAVAFIVMLNARGATDRKREDLSKLNRARQKKGKAPLKEFVVTRLSLSRGTANRAVVHGLDRAAARQHLVRGHFKTRKSGIYWWSPFVRGRADQVVLRERYAVLGNFMRTLAIPKAAEPWSLTSLREKLIKIGAKVVSHGRYVTFQMAEVAVSRQMFADILSLVARLRATPAPA